MSNFGSEKELFGAFALTGIRFSTYWLHPILMLTSFIIVVKKIASRTKIRKKYYLVFIVLPNLVSFWTSTYWILLLIILLMILKGKRLDTYVKYVFSGTMISSTFMILFLYPIFNPLINANRSLTERSDSISQTLQPFSEKVMTYIISFPVASILKNVFTTAFASGLIFSMVLFISISIYFKNSPQAVGIEMKLTQYIIIKSLFVLLPLLPFVFSFQEFMTYQAWWHKTTPFVLIFIIIVLLSFYVLKKIEVINFFVKPISILIFLVATLLSVSVYIDSSRELRNFSKSWDLGNYFSISYPLENQSEYMVENILRVKPYKLQYRDNFEKLLASQE
jgi:hypothetical protein